DRAVIDRGCGRPANVGRRRDLLRALEIGGADLQRPTRRRVPAEPHRIGVDAAALEVPAMLVGLATAESRYLDLEVVDDESRGQHAIRDVRAVEPMVADRTVRKLHAREPVHEGRWADRGLARQA